MSALKKCISFKNYPSINLSKNKNIKSEITGTKIYSLLVLAFLKLHSTNCNLSSLPNLKNLQLSQYKNYWVLAPSNFGLLQIQILVYLFNQYWFFKYLLVFFSNGFGNKVKA